MKITKKSLDRIKGKLVRIRWEDASADSTDDGSSYDTSSGDYHSQPTTDQTGFVINRADAAVGDGSGSTHEHGYTGISFLMNAGSASVNTSWHNIHQSITYSAESTIYEHGGGPTVRLANEDTDAIKFQFASGNIASGEITMFGVVNA